MRRATVEVNGHPHTATVDPQGHPHIDGLGQLDADQVRWQAPVNGSMFGVTLNYQGLLLSHLEEFHQPPYRKPPVKPVLFIKTPNTRNAHNQPVVFPKGVERLQPGPALGVIIGKAASRVSRQHEMQHLGGYTVGRAASRVSLEEAMQYVAGYTVVNEFSLPEDSYYRPAVKAKCRDGFCSVGPWVVDPTDIEDPHNLPIKLYVNGELRQENNTSNMVRSIAMLIAELSEFMTLNEGDLLITGTPEGRIDVQPGDVVEVEIGGIGRLSNTVIAE